MDTTFDINRMIPDAALAAYVASKPDVLTALEQFHNNRVAILDSLTTMYGENAGRLASIVEIVTMLARSAANGRDIATQKAVTKDAGLLLALVADMAGFQTGNPVIDVIRSTATVLMEQSKTIESLVHLAHAEMGKTQTTH